MRPSIGPMIYVPALALLALTSLHCKRDQATKPAAPEAEAKALLGIPLELPKAASGTLTEQNNLLIAIDAKGQLYVNAELTKDEALVDTLRERVKEKGAIQVVINADRSTPHGRVVQIIDRCRVAGVQRYSFAVAGSAPRPVEKPAD